MYKSIASISLLASLALAAPTAVELAPRCGTTVFPSILQDISSASPNEVFANVTTFDVSQEADRTNQIWQYVGFENIPSGATGCTLGATFPSNAVITANVNGDASQTPAVDVHTVFNGNPTEVVESSAITWNNFFPTSGTSPVGSGVFGTVTFKAGETVTINSEACATNLGFVFSITANIETKAAVEFTETSNPLTGVYLTYDC